MRLRPLSAADLVLAFALLAGLFLLAGGLSEHMGGKTEVLGPAFAVDGDTLDVRGTRIRLAGIDAPERHQTCGGATIWPCGEAAQTALQTALAAGVAHCEGRARDVYHRLVASCRVGEVDIAESLVRAGLALSAGRYSASELEARVTRRGLWSGPFVRPSDWRAEHPR